MSTLSPQLIQLFEINIRLGLGIESQRNSIRIPNRNRHLIFPASRIFHIVALVHSLVASNPTYEQVFHITQQHLAPHVSAGDRAERENVASNANDNVKAFSDDVFPGLKKRK